MKHLTCTLLLLCALSGASFAQDDPADTSSESGGDAERAVGFSSRLGLTGMQSMIDARTPSKIAIRGGVRYELEVIDQDFDGAVSATRKRKEHDVSFYAGGSLFGLVDLAARIPWTYRKGEDNAKGLVEFTKDSDRGWGDFDFSAKVTLTLGDFAAIAPYVSGHFPTGEPQVEDLLEFEYGAAATVWIFNHYLAAHANVAGLSREEGLTALRFRGGASFVAWSEPGLLIRFYGYGDGTEYEGRADFDFDLEFGAQVMLFGFLTAEVGFSTRLLDGGYLDDSSKRTLRRDLGVLDRHFEDDGTWQVYVGIGANFTF